jgi:hypothetical protein
MHNFWSAMVIALSLFAFGPTAAFANSANPKSPPFDSVPTGTHGGSNNTCTVGTDGCNTVTTTKSNPGGNNQTQTCTSPNKNVC